LKVTQETIAKAAGVSVTTVSFVLNGRAEAMKIPADTVQRVRNIADKLGFIGNYHARSLSLGRSNTIGLVTSGDGSDVRSRLYSPILTGMSVHARRRGYDLMMVADRPGMESQRCCISYLLEKRIDGAILLDPYYLPGLQWPDGQICVALGGWRDDMPRVELDASSGVQAALKHLRSLGHRRVFYVGRRTENGIEVPDRVEAFHRVARKLKMASHDHFVKIDNTLDNRHSVDWFVKQYGRAIAAELAPPSGTTAYLCYNDTMALALGAVLRDRGLRVPKDVSIVGFDDLHAVCAIPALTTISHMLPQLGERAVDLVADLMAAHSNTDTASLRIERVAAELVVRESTGPAPK